ncbi:MAG: hypothetical protein KatS3mg110_0111 [Pirellulaceae bacterium]|nr:MAG: hypothetical protein KatS3mg110_0111 [Pirellulaceae bacterium]
MADKIYYQAGLLLAIVGSVLVFPAAVWLIDYYTRPDIGVFAHTRVIPRWVVVLLFLGWIHWAYAVYVIQLRHTVVLDVMAILSAALATGAAVAFGWLLFGGVAAPLAVWLQLREMQESSARTASPAALWCLLVVALATAASVWANGKRQVIGTWQRSALDGDQSP